VPSINPDRDAVAGDTTGGDRPSYDLGRVRRDAGLLAACRSEAEERSTHALTQPASSLADERSEIVPHAGSAADRSAAAAAGTAIHRLMETLDLDAALRRQVESRRAEVLAWAAAEADRDAENARRRAAEILDALLQGGCLDRLEQRRSGVVARELPVIVPATGADPAIAAIVGVVDLIYEQNGRLVVADYKTDDVSGGETAAHAERYRPQLELYARALEDALELDYTPTMELWFLRADQIVTL
jgi:ATP-dependent helicase/nuclease subunit A